MKTANVHAGRLERWVRRMGNWTLPGFRGIYSFYSSCAIRGVSLLRLTALEFSLGTNHSAPIDEVVCTASIIAVEIKHIAIIVQASVIKFNVCVLGVFLNYIHND